MHSISLMNLKIVNRNPYLDWTNRIKFKESRRKKTEPLKVTYVFYGRKKKKVPPGDPRRLKILVSFETATSKKPDR